MAELTNKEIEYINTKPERKDGLILINFYSKSPVPSKEDLDKYNKHLELLQA